MFVNSYLSTLKEINQLFIKSIFGRPIFSLSLVTFLFARNYIFDSCRLIKIVNIQIRRQQTYIIILHLHNRT